MINTVLLILVICLLGTDASKDILQVPLHMMEKVKAVDDKCIKETGATSGSLENLIPWRLPNNEINQRYHYCFCHTIKMADDDGIFDFNNTMRFFHDSNKQEDIKNAFTTCSVIRGKDKYDTAYKFTDCFFDKAPVILTL